MDFNSDFSASSGSGKGLRHPTVTFFHLVFRVAALFVYIFGTYFSSSFIGIFVSVTLLLSLDFWTVKNVTGRIMVGLRWWNFINDEGKSEWKFESRNSNDATGSNNSSGGGEVSIFWGGLVLAPALWAVLFLVALSRFNFQWIILVIIALSLTSSNLFGYVRCRYGTSESISSTMFGVANSYMQTQMLNNVKNLVTGGGAGGGGGSGGMQQTI